MKNPIVSIIIPTYSKSKDFLEIPLKSIANQNCPKEFYEIILADNLGGNHVKVLAEQYEARIVEVKGKPSQGCRQINLGVSEAKGEYVLLVDHDIELSSSLIRNFVESVKDKKIDVDAWYVPYKIIARGKILTKVRNFEQQFNENSVIVAPRLIKRSTFLQTESHYDPQLNLGPADWDLNIQLKLIGAKFGYLESYFYHHEESLNFWQYLLKKTIYSKGSELYKKKWRKKDIRIYNNIIKKQYSPLYRLFWIFIENGKWRKLIKNLHLYLLFIILRLIGIIPYLFSLF